MIKFQIRSYADLSTTDYMHEYRLGSGIFITHPLFRPEKYYRPLETKAAIARDRLVMRL